MIKSIWFFFLSLLHFLSDAQTLKTICDYVHAAAHMTFYRSAQSMEPTRSDSL